MRGDVQALRALAVLAVVAYHARNSLLPGGFIGVDVFFVISGFLICGALIREVAERGRISFGAFYARRARRILPMSIIVTVVSLLVALTVASPVRMLVWGQPYAASSIVKDGVSALLYVPNFWFTLQGNDYLASPSASPFLHYWSLGIEEQFYVLVPVALAIAWLLGRRTLTGLGWAIGLGTAASYAYGVWLTHVDPVTAYFHPFARGWELGIGGCVALAVHATWSPWGQTPAWLLRSTGLVVLVATMAWGTLGAAWPGWAAIVPAAATATILWAGALPGAAAAGWWSLAPIQRIGDWSYSLYLWHWPALVIAALALNRELHGWEAGLVALGAIALAAVSYHLVELPAWSLPVDTPRQRRRILVTSGVAVALALVVAGMVASVASSRLPGGGDSESAPTASPASIPTAAATQDLVFATELPQNLRPRLDEAISDNSRVYRNGCHLSAGDYVIKPACTIGSGNAPVVVIFGDSHAAQWVEPFAAAADRGELTLLTLTASDCPGFEVAPTLNPPRTLEDCAQWRAAAMEAIDAANPDVIVMSSSHWYPLEGGVDRADAYATALADAVASLPPNARVVVIGDTARAIGPPIECAVEHANDLAACSTPLDEATIPAVGDAMRAATEGAGGVYFDPVPYMCSSEMCGVVIGDLFVYRDNHHINVTFSRTFDDLLFEAAGL